MATTPYLLLYLGLRSPPCGLLLSRWPSTTFVLHESTGQLPAHRLNCFPMPAICCVPSTLSLYLALPKGSGPSGVSEPRPPCAHSLFEPRFASPTRVARRAKGKSRGARGKFEVREREVARRRVGSRVAASGVSKSRIISFIYHIISSLQTRRTTPLAANRLLAFCFSKTAALTADRTYQKFVRHLVGPRGVCGHLFSGVVGLHVS